MAGYTMAVCLLALKVLAIAASLRAAAAAGVAYPAKSQRGGDRVRWR